jgi:hypothetical protein
VPLQDYEETKIMSEIVMPTPSDEYLQRLQVLMQQRIDAVLQEGMDAIPPMTVCSVSDAPLTLGSLRRAFHLCMGVDRLVHPPEQTASEIMTRSQMSWPMYPPPSNALVAYDLIEDQCKPLPSLRDRMKVEAATSRHGIASSANNGRIRRHLCMGIVKTCDDKPNWDTKAMERGENWEYPERRGFIGREQ